MELSGVWRAATADDQLRRTAVGLSFDDADWPTIAVPGHWRNEPAFATSDGPLLLRTHFDHPIPKADERCWVVLDGVFYQADVWFDGAYIGDPEGYFFPHSFDVTSLARLATEHVLAVEVACSPQTSHRGRRNITGVFQNWDAADRSWNPGGLWRDVHIETTGAVRLDRLRVLCRDANEARAHLRLHGRLDSDVARTVRLRTTVDGIVLSQVEQSLARGVNEVDWTLDIDNPSLWWPWSLGDQPLCDVRVDVVVDGVVSHTRSVRTGLREVAMHDWVFSVNGERLFLKGANLAPTRLDIANATADELRRDVELARDAGLDLLRVHGHISAPPLYDAADELGMLLWQDFPLQWSYAREVRRRAVTQATEAVFHLGHHPSILTWCAHNEPSGAAIGLQSSEPTWRSAARYVAGQQLPSWNKNILDRWVKRAFERADETRPTTSHSGVMPHIPEVGGTDSHLYFGWYHGDERDLPGFAAAFPRMVRFVSEFGAQAVPTSSEFIDPSGWPYLAWDELEERHGLQRSVLERYAPAASFGSFDQWRLATQRYQSAVLRHHIETLRRLKYHPSGGFCLFMLNDSSPSISWSILDHLRVPKLAYHAVTEACRPVIVVADRLPATVSPGDTLALDVHVVNDLRTAIDSATLRAQLRWSNGEHEWSFEGSADADSVVRIATLQFVVPDAPGDLWLDLTLEADNVAATNRGQTLIVARA
ncbi:MAG: putative glycosidase [Acidimicrobiales bacterium]|nr:putative glycosidase [Acidimicrobiales bacterium]